MAVSQWKLAWLTPNLGILWISVSSFWLCESIVANPIIYRLVPRPSRFETRQWSLTKALDRWKLVTNKCTTIVKLVGIWALSYFRGELLTLYPIHLSFICIYHFDTLNLVEWQDTCHACGSLVWPCSPRVSRDSVVFGGVWRVMGSTPVGCTENSFPEYFDLRTLFIVYTLSKSPIHVRQCLTTLPSTFKLVKVLRAAFQLS